MAADAWHKTRRLTVTARPAAPLVVTARLQALPGVAAVRWLDAHQLEISYHLRQLEFAQISAELADSGVPLAMTFWDRLRYGLWSYVETIQREADAAPSGWDSDVQRIYVSRYRRHRHGFRDERLQQWRKYLDKNDGAPAAKP
jgi:hypothetical protein